MKNIENSWTNGMSSQIFFLIAPMIVVSVLSGCNGSSSKVRELKPYDSVKISPPQSSKQKIVRSVYSQDIERNIQDTWLKQPADYGHWNDFDRPNKDTGKRDTRQNEGMPWNSDIIRPPSGAVPIVGKDTLGVRMGLSSQKYVKSAFNVKICMLIPAGDSDVSIRTLAGSLHDAAKMALQDIGDKNLQLKIYDIASDVKNVVQRAVNDNCSIMVGPLFSKKINIVKEATLPRGIPVISFSTDADKARDNIFLIGFLPEQEVKTILEYAVSQGYKRISVFSSVGNYGDTVTEAAQIVTQNLGGTIVTSVRYLPSYEGIASAAEIYTAEFHPVVDEKDKTKQKTYDDSEKVSWVDAILLAESGRRLQGLAAYLAYNDVNTKEVQFLGTGGWKSDLTLKEASLKKGVFSAPYSRTLQKFFRRFQKKYGYQPREIAGLGYDAIAAIGVMVAQAREQKKSIIFDRETIASPTGFLGVMGAFRFLPDGKNERKLAILRVGDNEFDVVKFPDQSFEIEAQDYTSFTEKPTYSEHKK